MRVSQFFKLNRDQSSLDFVDVDTTNDVPLFVDPAALRSLSDPWAASGSKNIQDFFRVVIDCVKNGDRARAIKLLSGLREPNETHLGLSQSKSSGSALGPGTAESVWDSLIKSKAATSGLITDLEDTALLVEKISHDRISDIVINLIRQHLIEYTQNCAAYYNIPLAQDVSTGPIWNADEEKWDQGYASLPMGPSGKILLIPKLIVRRRPHYDPDEYYNDYILDILAQDEINSNSSLVHILKNGSPRVTKKDLKAKYGSGKSAAISLTLRRPSLLANYKSQRRATPNPPMTHDGLAHYSSASPPDFKGELDKLSNIPTGAVDATRYEDQIERLATMCLYPDLAGPVKQSRIHDGRKIIDIDYRNEAIQGFFRWLGMHYPASRIMVECKNYTEDPTNPEVDQLAGRFSNDRGMFGVISCRKFNNKERFWKRCIDTSKDGRGFVIPMDDSNWGELAILRSRDNEEGIEKFFFERFKRLTD